MSGVSVRLLTFGSGRRELGFEFSLRGADQISTSTSGRSVLKPHARCPEVGLDFWFLRCPEVGLGLLLLDVQNSP